MPITIRLIDSQGKRREIIADHAPGMCPRCERYGAVNVRAAVQTGSEFDARHDAIAVCECGSLVCAPFVAFYALIVENGIETARLMSHTPLDYTNPAKFSDAILKLSPTFCETYDHAVRAQENGLSQICGAGYRRALEFLVKDFAISRVSDPTDDHRTRIARMFLIQCIREYLPGPVQEAAKRAAWLGNDETHYYRAWTERDVSDLRALIDLTVKFVDFSLELDHYVSAMPEPRP